MVIKAAHTSFALFFLVCIQSSLLFSQGLKDTIRLSEVEVSGNFPLRNHGFKKVKIDSTILNHYLNADLSTILTQYSTLFIKSNGNGSLSTPSLRGTSANHTQVEWNGIRINSPMLGQIDLSQIPVSQFESVEILYGPATVAKTSGAFGGIINLTSNPDWNNQVNLLLAQTVASFESYTTNANLAIGNKKIQSVTKFNYSNATNNFPYYNDQTKTREKMTNAAYILGGITQEAFLKLSGNDLLSARIWYSDNYHQLPPITTNINDTLKEELRDRCIRSMAEWKRTGNHYFMTVTSSLADEYMQYNSAALNQDHRSYSWNNRARMVYSGVKNLTIKPGLDFNEDWVRSDAYQGEKNRNLLGAFAEVSYALKGLWQFSLLMRQDIVDGKFQPFIPTLGIEYKPFRKTNLTFSANMCRNYRLPTLNDLYFGVTANPGLDPETDYTVEGGSVYNFHTKQERFFIEAELTGYYSKMINLIQWIPQSSGEWAPLNIAEVHARGLEAHLNLSWNIKTFGFSFTTNYNYCKSTNEKAKSAEDASVGKQLIYTPVNTLNDILTLTLSGFYFTYVFTYTGLRYTSTDNLYFMPGYNLSNIILGKDFHLSKIILSLQLQINNLFNLDYQSIANRPMPGRNYALTLKFNFSK
ncbi:MAG: TonB-dependent receptor plug domain-containing protein [Bacteroidetes bacterium]|nr:TonB-dependent receptor plug domain-containing protein [Bacteroidota bacterium]